MVEQTSDGGALDSGIGAEEVFVIEVIKFASCRRFDEAPSSLMAGRSPGILMALFVVLPDCAHERRKKKRTVFLSSTYYSSGNKQRTVLEYPDIFVSALHKLSGDRSGTLCPVGEQKDRNSRLAAVNKIEQTAREALFRLVELHICRDQQSVDIHLIADDRHRLKVSGDAGDAAVAFFKFTAEAVEQTRQGTAVFHGSIFDDDDTVFCNIFHFKSSFFKV